MTPEEEQLQVQIREAKRIKNLADRQYYYLVSKCGHEFSVVEGSVQCTICGEWGNQEERKL